MTSWRNNRLTARTAQRLEFVIIGIGLVALIMIFQPFSFRIFSLGCGLVVVAALFNNLLPFAEEGRSWNRIVFVSTVVLLLFFTALLVAIVAAYLYGVTFLTPPPAGTSLVKPKPPFWMHPLVWQVVVIDLLLWVAVFQFRKRKPTKNRGT